VNRIRIVDGGVSYSFPRIEGYLNRSGRSIKELDVRLHTHSHLDHMGCSSAIREASGCRVAAHVDATPWIEDIDLQYRIGPTATFHCLVSRPVGVDQILSDGDTLDMGGGQTLRIFHPPGHSRGSVSFMNRIKPIFRAAPFRCREIGRCMRISLPSRDPSES